MVRRLSIHVRFRAAIVLALVLRLLLPLPAQADDKRFRLAAPAPLVESGLLDYLLPRFSLKTGVRIEVVTPGTGAEAAFGTGEGRKVFVGAGATWRLRLGGDHPGAARFAEWLTSEIGQRTVTSYEVEGTAPFDLPEVQAVADEVPEFDGDAERGARVAQAKCGRCHVVDPERRGGIASTPSFPVLRTLNDWDVRFQTFYALNPHPAFTQVPGVTEEFAKHLIPSIPCGRLGTPEDAGYICGFLASGEASWITGQLFSVDGGSAPY